MPESPPDPASSAQAASVPGLRPLVLVALALPVLAMIVIGASRFEKTHSIRVRAGEIETIEIRPGDGDAAPAATASDQGAYGSSAADSALASLTAADATGHDHHRIVETVLMEVTAYCPCSKCCGKNARGITASGKPVTFNGGRFVAADRKLPFGTRLLVPGYADGAVVEVTDRGGAIKGNRLDVYFPDHDTARQWGRQLLPVQIIRDLDEPLDDSPIPLFR